MLKDNFACGLESSVVTVEQERPLQSSRQKLMVPWTRV